MTLCLAWGCAEGTKLPWLQRVRLGRGRDVCHGGHICCGQMPVFLKQLSELRHGGLYSIGLSTAGGGTVQLCDMEQQRASAVGSCGGVWGLWRHGPSPEQWFSCKLCAP